ncbi:MAG: DegT/DnrJ/EryC1/StrS family aminotransferase [Leptospiraceae bacterium]|nr:DegT/DnrJ/EryC1/StrS family aminotransferase [Leptospiraceae bacterium]MDW8306420.1 DegT/DnrJ/EryC1/StrS family aminotransferase [Leptospiraceae bacterium]
MDEPIPFYIPSVPKKKALFYLNQALKNHWLTTGPLTAEFEEKLAQFLKVKRILAVSSGTAALHLALRVLGIGPKDRVLLPANTFVATLEVVHHLGAVPVLGDICPYSWNLSLDEIKKKGRGAKALLLVPFAGNPPPMDEIQMLCQKYGLKLILDSAHALEARYKERFLHEYADACAFSFYATKNLTTAEGGALYLAQESLYEKARSLSLHGMTREAWLRYQGGTWHYDVKDFGYKMNLSDVHAAIGLAQIEKLKENHEKRQKLDRLYRKLLHKDGIRLQGLWPEAISAHHLFVISLDPKYAKREALSNYLREKKIGHSVHFIPLYRFSAVRKTYGFRPSDFPNTENYYQGALSLPFFPLLKESQLRKVALTVDAFLKTL